MKGNCKRCRSSLDGNGRNKGNGCKWHDNGHGQIIVGGTGGVRSQRLQTLRRNNVKEMRLLHKNNKSSG
jgi:hypothetical protein